MSQTNTDTRLEQRRKLRTEYLKLLNFKMTVHESGGSAIVEGPGLTHDDFDMNGMLRPWKLLKMLEAVRFFAHHYPLDEDGHTFRDYAAITDNRLTFLSSCEFTMNRELYDHRVPKSSLRVRLESAYVGTSSANTKAVIISSVDQKILFTNVNQVVSIDRSTRKPMPLPEWWRNKYSEFSKGHASLIFPKFEKKPNAACYQVKVAWSDTDFNNHTNWTSYLRFAVDGGHHCSDEGFLPNFEKNYKVGIKNIQIRYAGESHEGDILDVYVWQDDEKSELLYVDIHRGKESIFQTTIEFLQPKPSL
ncbi:hypothetical protein ScPMuIL_018024 [Solemya velum]